MLSPPLAATYKDGWFGAPGNQSSLLDYDCLIARSRTGAERFSISESHACADCTLRKADRPPSAGIPINASDAPDKCR